MPSDVPFLQIMLVFSWILNLLLLLMPIEMWVGKWLLDREVDKNPQKRAKGAIQDIEWLKQASIQNTQIGTKDFTEWYQRELSRLMRGAADAELLKAYLQMDVAKEFLEISVVGNIEQMKSTPPRPADLAARLDDLITRVRYIRSKLETPNSIKADVISNMVLEDDAHDPSELTEVRDSPGELTRRGEGDEGRS